MGHDEVKEIKKLFTELQSNLNQKFDQIDKRFEQVDLRFDQVDKRLEKISKDIESIERVTKFREMYENIDRLAKQGV